MRNAKQMRSGTLTFLSVLLVVAATATARADEPPCKAEAAAVAGMKKRDPSLASPTDPAAREHNEAAKRAFGVQDYETAIREYTSAGLKDSAPLILYNLAQTYRAAKQYEKAIVQYKRFVDRGDPGPEVRALVECHVREMTAEMEHAAATAPPSGPPPDQADQPNSAGTADQDATDAGGAADAAQPAGSPRRSRWTGTRRAAVGVGLVGVAALGTGIVFGVQANGYRDEAAGLCPSNPCGNAEEANRLSDKADSRALFANVSFGASAALIVGAAVLWYVGSPSSAPDTDSAFIVPQISPTSAGVAFTTRF